MTAGVAIRLCGQLRTTSGTALGQRGRASLPGLLRRALSCGGHLPPVQSGATVSEQPSVEAQIALLREIVNGCAVFGIDDANRALDSLTQRVKELEGVANDVIWLDNNIHNYGTDGWRSYFKAALRDAKRVMGRA